MSNSLSNGVSVGVRSLVSAACPDAASINGASAAAILRRFGTDAHVYLPGIGTLNGLTAGNYLDSALTTAATVDNPVGGVVDAVGTINATQATTANKPILRRGATNLLLQSGLTGGIAGVTGSTAVAPTGWAFGFTGSSISFPQAGQIRYVSTVGTQRGFLQQTVSVNASATYTLQVKVISVESGNLTISNVITVASLPVGASVTTYRRNGATFAGNAVIATGDLLEAVLVTGITAGTVSCRVGNGSSGDATFGVATFSAPQFEVGSTASAYSPTTSAAASNPSAGKYSWQFDGSNDTLALGSVPFQLADDHCVVVGVSNTKAAGAGVVFALAGATVQRIAQIYYATTVPTFSWVDDASVGVAHLGVAQTVGTVQVLTGRKSDTTYTSRVNGVAVGSSVIALGTTTVNSQSIGAHKATPANFHQGSIGPVIAIKGTVTDAELLTLERFVSSLTPSGPVF
jgi:hypothetical protein